MKFRRQIFSLIFLLVSALAFQNCGGFRGLVSQESLESLKLQGGNGGGYEGKPDGTYYRFVPNFMCSNQSSAQAIAEIKSGQAFLYDNQQDQCAQQSTPIAPSDLDISPFQNEFISVQDALFKRYDEKPEGIPQDLAEVLCRDDFEKPSFEIVSHFDRETHQARARVYFQGHAEDDFVIGRVLSPTEVRYVSGELEFSVDLSKSMPARKYSGTIVSTKITGVASTKLTCVIGGSLDTSNWKFRELSQISASVIRFLGQETVFVHKVSQWVSQLYKISPDNSTIDFTEKYFGPQASLRAINPSPEENKNLMFFQIRWASDIFDSDYLFQINEDRMTRLTNTQAGPAQGKQMIASGFTENQHFIYNEYDTFNRTSAYYDLNLVTGVKENFLNGAFVVTTLKRLNKAVIYDLSDQKPRSLKIYDTVTRTKEVLAVKLPDSCWMSSPPYNFGINRDQSVMTYYQCANTLIQTLVEVSAIDGSVHEIGKNSQYQWVSEDQRWLVFNDQSSRILYNTETRKSFPTPLQPGLVTYRGDTGVSYKLRSGNEPVIIDQRWMYGFGDEEKPPTLYKFDLTTGQFAKLCQALPGKKLWIGTLPDRTLYLFTYDETLKLYRFYEIENGQDCTLLNQFPSPYSVAISFSATSIGFTVQLGNTEYVETQQVIFVPVDGRPPLKLNWSDTGHWDAQVAPDNRRILMLGPASNGQTRVFSFDLF